jgi:RND family efflux transporter MFP subunit
MIGRGLGSGPMSLVLVALGTLSLLPTWAAGQPPAKKADDVPRVKVVRPVMRQVSDYEDFVGRIEAAASVEIRPRVGGMLVNVQFVPGTLVRKGDVLFEIDPRPYQAALDRADAEVDKAIARLKRAMADFDRAKVLMDRAVMAQDEFRKFESSLAEVQADLKIAQASRDIVRLELSHTKVTAPIDGRIDRARFSPGNLVTADSPPLTTIDSVDPIHVAFDVDERTALRLRRMSLESKAKGGMKELPLRIGLVDEDDLPRQGRVAMAANRLDPATNTLRLHAVLPNPDGLLLPGMTARARLTVGPPHDALLVPEIAVFQHETRIGVMVVTAGDIVKFRPVDRGLTHGVLLEVKEGLTAGDWVVESPYNFEEQKPNVVDGMTIHPDRITPPGP